MYMTGCSLPSEYWDKPTPKPVSDVSNWRMKGKEKSGSWGTGWVVSAVFKRWKALSVSSVQETFSGSFFIRSVRGQATEEKSGMRHQ